MEIYTYPDVNLKDTAVTIGKFDGVHHGHRYLIDILKEKAAEKKLKTVVFVVDMEDDTSGRLDIVFRSLTGGAAEVKEASK